MKYAFLILMVLFSVLGCSASSSDKSDATVNNGSRSENTTDENTMEGNTINIKVGARVFTATLLNNNSARAFKDLLPLTINMIELNGNEKYYDLPGSLPTNAASPGTIRNGDIMLYGSKTLVLFYKTFSTSYSYTKLGAVDDTAGLASALGAGNVSVTFETQQE